MSRIIFHDHEKDGELCAAFWGTHAEIPAGEYLEGCVTAWAEEMDWSKSSIVTEMFAYLEAQAVLAECKTLQPFTNFEDFAKISLVWVLNWLEETNWAEEYGDEKA